MIKPSSGSHVSVRCSVVTRPFLWAHLHDQWSIEQQIVQQITANLHCHVIFRISLLLHWYLLPSLPLRPSPKPGTILPISPPFSLLVWHSGPRTRRKAITVNWFGNVPFSRGLQRHNCHTSTWQRQFLLYSSTKQKRSHILNGIKARNMAQAMEQGSCYAPCVQKTIKKALQIRSCNTPTCFQSSERKCLGKIHDKCTVTLLLKPVPTPDKLHLKHSWCSLFTFYSLDSFFSYWWIVLLLVKLW